MTTNQKSEEFKISGLTGNGFKPGRLCKRSVTLSNTSHNKSILPNNQSSHKVTCYR